MHASGESRRDELLTLASYVYEAPVRLIEDSGKVELLAAGRLMCAAYSMHGYACQMLLDFLHE